MSGLLRIETPDGTTLSACVSIDGETVLPGILRAVVTLDPAEPVKAELTVLAGCDLTVLPENVTINLVPSLTEPARRAADDLAAILDLYLIEEPPHEIGTKYLLTALDAYRKATQD